MCDSRACVFCVHMVRPNNQETSQNGYYKDDWSKIPQCRVAFRPPPVVFVFAGLLGPDYSRRPTILSHVQEMPTIPLN